MFKLIKNISSGISKHFFVLSTKNLLAAVILAATKHGLLPADGQGHVEQGVCCTQPRLSGLSNVELLWKNKDSSSNVAMRRQVALTSIVRRLAELIILLFSILEQQNREDFMIEIFPDIQQKCTHIYTCIFIITGKR